MTDVKPCTTCDDTGEVSEDHGGYATETLSCPDCGHLRDYSKPGNPIVRPDHQAEADAREEADWRSSGYA